MSDLYDVKISVRSSVKLLPEIKGLLSMKPDHESELIFMGKEKRNFLMKHIMWLVDDFDAWNAFPWSEYIWGKFYKRTVNVVSRHTEYHLAQLKKNPNFNAIYNLYGFAWAFKENVIPCGLAWSKVTTFKKSDYEELFGPMSNLNVALISSPKEMSREKCMEHYNGMYGDTEDGTFVDRVVGKICPKMNRMSVNEGDGVLDSQSDDVDGVLYSQTKDVIEEATMLPTMSSNCPEARNAAASSSSIHPENDEDVSHLDDNMKN
nr:phospholipase-like protein [Tanacetum cinerariifolium]